MLDGTKNILLTFKGNCIFTGIAFFYFKSPSDPKTVSQNRSDPFGSPCRQYTCMVTVYHNRELLKVLTPMALSHSNRFIPGYSWQSPTVTNRPYQHKPHTVIITRWRDILSNHFQIDFLYTDGAWIFIIKNVLELNNEFKLYWVHFLCFS